MQQAVSLQFKPNAVEGSMLNSNTARLSLLVMNPLTVDLSNDSSRTIGTSEIIGDNLITGDLTANGDNLVQQQVSNLNVEDKFVLFNSGSTSGDGGIVNRQVQVSERLHMMTQLHVVEYQKQMEQHGMRHLLIQNNM